MPVMRLTLNNAKDFALNQFSNLPVLEQDFNKIHSESIIKILKIICPEDIDKEKLFALAWVHDIGKIISEENHALNSVNILEKNFELDNTEKDCILNHGSSAKPLTEEGKIFRYADGLSLFTSETINFLFYALAKEGKDFEEINNKIKSQYEKYKMKYSDSEEIIALLERLFKRSI
jgi:HD superfamily phosphodiesterase